MQNLLEGFKPITKEEWLKQIEKELKGKSIETLDWKITDNLLLKPFYLSGDINTHAPTLKVALSQQRNICEYIIVDEPTEANKKALKALMLGANSLHFNCINAELYDNFFEVLLNEIEWEYIHIDFTFNHGEIFVNELHKWCLKKQIDTKTLQGSFCYDVYHRQLTKGIAADENGFKNFLVAAKQQFPKMTNLNIYAASYLNAGANVIQELAYTCAHVNEYLNLLREADLLSQINALHIQIAVGSNYLVEIAKLRSLRLILASVFEKYDLNLEVFIHAHTATINKSHKDAYNNMLRATTEVMSAIIGGANQISARPYDAISAQTTEFSERIARNIALILSEESYLDKVIDPAAGSYLLEKLTEEIAEKSWEKFCSIENKGGWKALLHNGEMIKDIESNAERLIEEYRNNNKVLIGVNKYPNKNDKELTIVTKEPKATAEPNTLTEIIISSML